MTDALLKLAEEDPTFQVNYDDQTGQTIIAGMGELHLDIIVDRLKREFRVQCNVGRPQVAYRETISRKVKQEGRFVRQSGGRGQYGHVWIELGPAEPGTGFKFEDKIVGGTVPREFIPAVEKGIKEALDTGVLSGFPVVEPGTCLAELCNQSNTAQPMMLTSVRPTTNTFQKPLTKSLMMISFPDSL